MEGWSDWLTFLISWILITQKRKSFFPLCLPSILSVTFPAQQTHLPLEAKKEKLTLLFYSNEDNWEHIGLLVHVS